MKYTFNNTSFTSKKAVDEYIRNIRNTLVNNETLIINPTDEYYPVFNELVEIHYHKNEKIGPGIKFFYFTKDYYKNYQLRIRRIDDTDVDISYQFSKITLGPSYNDNLNSALRRAVDNQILKYKNTLDKTKLFCNICKIKLDSFEIDHVTSFYSIKHEFINDNPPPKEFYDDIENTCSKIFKKEDHDYKIKWQQFHKSKAIYQVLCLPCNRKKWRH